ncbi:MAG: hypothetical protein E6Q24_14645 [Chitinophagaceae bacterium]|nr:MAG: hypothetical protein E6Q24_14645 [Chitinophagaceae bacterium]
MSTCERILQEIAVLKDLKKQSAESFDFKIKLRAEALEALMKKEGLTTLKVEGATAYWQGQTKAVVNDWNAVMNYIFDNKAFDMMQRRLSPKNVKARIDAGAKIEGVTIVDGEKIFIVKGAKDESEE